MRRWGQKGPGRMGAHGTLDTRQRLQQLLGRTNGREKAVGEWAVTIERKKK